MPSQEMLEKYARLAVEVGINVQKGQCVCINANLDCADFVRLCAKAAYDAGAGGVEIIWQDEAISRLNYERGSSEFLNSPAPWKVQRYDYCDDKDYAYLYIDADDPDAYAGVDADVIGASLTAMRKANKRHANNISTDRVAWSIVALPTEKWAQKVFPGDPDAVKKLYEQIFAATYLTADDPVATVNAHSDDLQRRCKLLNGERFDALHCVNSLGTDVTIGLAENNLWGGGNDEKLGSSVTFAANMPTEEVYTAPHNRRIDGVIKSSMPLCYNGQMIDGISVSFKDGRVTDYSAEVGADTLKHIIDTDEGSRSLGEIALVPCDSPIYKSGVFFYSTLFDENAACHVALGQCYAPTIEGGDSMTYEELAKFGGNDSAIHVDFMFGTPDMRIDGIKDGKTTPVFVDGNWAEAFK